MVLTGAHFEHLGFAAKARSELGVPVYVHENDVPLTRHPWRYDHERPRSWCLATQIRALPMVAAFVRNRALVCPPVEQVVRYKNGVLPVPGSPHVVFCRATRTATARCAFPSATCSWRATRS